MSYRSIFRPGLVRGPRRRRHRRRLGHRPLHRARARQRSAPRVAIVGRKPEKLERVAGEIRERGRQRQHPCRATSATRTTVARHGRRRFSQAHGRIDGLVNNAGGQFPAPLEAISGKGWDAVVRNNLVGRLPVRARVLHAVDARHVARVDCGIVNIIADMWDGMPGMGALGRGARRHAQPHRDGGAGVGAAARAMRSRQGSIASSGMDRHPPDH